MSYCVANVSMPIVVTLLHGIINWISIETVMKTVPAHYLLNLVPSVKLLVVLSLSLRPDHLQSVLGNQMCQ